MKRYLVFIGENYYPCGGMGDFVGDFDSVEECKNSIKEHFNNEFKKSYNNFIKSTKLNNSKQIIDLSCWVEIYDSKTREEVWNQSNEL